MPAFIIILLGIALIIALFFFMWIDLVLIVVLLFSKYYMAVIIGIPLLTLIRTMLYYNVDLFADDCESFPSNFCYQIENEDELEEMFNVVNNPDVWHKSPITRNYAYTISQAPHTCHNQSTVLYSPNKKYKATISHIAWHHYFLYQQNEFTITWEKLDHAE